MSMIESAKKNKKELVILLVISIGVAFLLLNYIRQGDSFVLPNLVDLGIWSMSIFSILTIVYFFVTPKAEGNSDRHVLNGYHELFNENNQLTKKGLFECGKLLNGTKYVYKRDGTLSNTVMCKAGMYSDYPDLNNESKSK